MIKIGGYLLDGAASEEEGLEAETTAYPVESGAVITDHTTNQPLTLALEFVVSDTPIGEVAGARAAGVVPSSEARQVLTALRATRVPFTVEVGGRSYPSMIFTSLSFPRDKSTGDALRGTASLKQIQIVDVRRVSVALGAKKGLGRRPSRYVPGKKMWLCPPNTAVLDTDTANLAHGCREVITLGIGNGLVPYLAFADTFAPLTDAEKARMGRQRIGTKSQNFAGEFNPIRQFWTEPTRGAQLTKVSTADSTLRLVGSVPSDYEPPVMPDRPDRGNRI